MAVLPHLHVLLDKVETILMDQAVKEVDRDLLNDALYRPELIVNKSGGGWKPPPGFDPDSIEEGFDALAGDGT